MMFIALVIDTGDKLFNLSMVWLTPVLYPCQGFSVIAGDNNTGNKFIAGDDDTSEHRCRCHGHKFISGDKN